MRLAIPAALLLGAATGCSGDRLQFDHESELWSETRGVALHDDGNIGHAAMNDTTCEFFTGGGELGGDFDLPSDAERVVDARAGVVLATTQNDVYVVQTARWPAYDTVSARTPVIDAQLYSGGVAVLTADGVQFHDADRRTDVELPIAGSAGFAVDRLSGDAYVTQGDAVYRVSVEGVERLDGAGTMARFDTDHGMLWLTGEGQREVSGLDVDSGVLWTVELDAPVVSMDTIGSEGRAAIMTDTALGGEIVVVDAESGIVEQQVGTPGIGEIVFSADGGSMALVTPDVVHMYDVTRGAGVEVYYSKEAADVAPAPAFAD